MKPGDMLAHKPEAPIHRPAEEMNLWGHVFGLVANAARLRGHSYVGLGDVDKAAGLLARYVVPSRPWPQELPAEVAEELWGSALKEVSHKALCLP